MGQDATTPSNDDPALTHRQLRAALELAIAVATDPGSYGIDRAIDPPEALRPYAAKQRLSNHELGRVRRAVVAAPEFRAAVGAAAGDQLDELGGLWLQRPPAWQERAGLVLRLEAEHDERVQVESALKREQKRRESAERKRERLTESAGHAGSRVEALDRRIDELQQQLEAERTTAATLRDELATARTERRHAVDRQRAAERRRDEVERELDEATRRAAKVEAQRDELLAQRASARGTIPGSAVSDARKLADELRRHADQLHQLLAPPAVAPRQPLAVPGAIHDDPDAVAEMFVRSGALLLVDGYNVAMLAWSDVSLADQRRRLLDALDNVVRRYGTEIVVVFDGADVVGATAEARRLSRVRYSPAGITADDVIRDEVAATPADRPVVVVTNDREIQRDVGRLGANVLSSDAFASFTRR